jgi:hypothetical protein
MTLLMAYYPRRVELAVDSPTLPAMHQLCDGNGMCLSACQRVGLGGLVTVARIVRLKRDLKRLFDARMLELVTARNRNRIRLPL